MKAYAHPFNNERSSGLDISWSCEKGFGHLTIACNKATGEWSFDTESMGPKFVGRVFSALVGTTMGDDEPWGITFEREAK